LQEHFVSVDARLNRSRFSGRSPAVPSVQCVQAEGTRRRKVAGPNSRMTARIFISSRPWAPPREPSQPWQLLLLARPPVPFPRPEERYTRSARADESPCAPVGRHGGVPNFGVSRSPRDLSLVIMPPSMAKFRSMRGSFVIPSNGGLVQRPAPDRHRDLAQSSTRPALSSFRK
jgi:hypothetical protein